MSWTLHHGDCLDPVSGLASLPDRSVDHVITDPPYEAEAHSQQVRRNPSRKGGLDGMDREPAVKYTPLSFGAMAEETRLRVGLEVGRITRRWALVFCQVEAVRDWSSALVAGGLEYVRTCVWVKPNAQPQFTGDRPGMGYESIVVAHRKGKKRWNGGGRRGVFTANVDMVGRLHETQKPVDLMRELVELFTDADDLICDPFAGSGTTGVAATMLGRRFVGWERDEEYAAIARRRLSGEEAKPRHEQPSLFGGAS